MANEKRDSKNIYIQLMSIMKKIYEMVRVMCSLFLSSNSDKTFRHGSFFGRKPEKMLKIN